MTGVVPTPPYFVGDPIGGGLEVLPKLIAVTQSWSHGHLPIWYPYEGYGFTLAGNQAAPWFFPEILTHLMFRTNLSMWPIVGMYLSAIGVYLLLRQLGRSYVASVVGAVLAILSGPMIANINMEIINPLVVAPYLAITLVKLASVSGSRRLIWLTLYALALSQLLLSGFAEVVPYISLSSLLIALSRLDLRRENHPKLRRLLVGLALATAVALCASIVATYELLSTLHSYSAYQSPLSYLSWAPPSWLTTLIDPTLFGSTLTAAGQTVWLFGNPFLWPLSAGAIRFAFHKSSTTLDRRSIAVLAGLTLFGLLGFVNAAHILNIFALPYLRDITNVRFLGFLWWLPLCILSSYGIDALGHLRPTAYLATGLAVIAIVVTERIVAHPSSAPTTHLTETFTVVASMMTIGTLIILLGPRTTSLRPYGIGLLTLCTLELFIPRYLAPARQLYNQPLPLKQILATHGIQSTILDSTNNIFVSPTLADHGLSTIQEYDPFLARGLGRTLTYYFGHEDVRSPSSPIYPLAPALYNLIATPLHLDELATIGVGAVITPGTLPNTAPTTTQTARLTSTEFRALTHLVSLYLTHNYLQSRYPLTGDSPLLLQWAVSPHNTTPKIALGLRPYQSAYAALLQQESAEPSFQPFNAVIVTTPSITDLGATVIGGLRLNIYGLDMAANASKVWVPNEILSDPNLVHHGEIISNAIATVASQSLARSLSSSAQGELVTSVTISQSSNSLRATFTSPVKEFVVLRATIPPGSSVSVNGAPAQLITVDGVWSGVMVPKGADRVIINESQLTVTVLFWLDLSINLGLVGLAAYLGLIKLPKTRRAAAVETA
jgi:hypothetical protein